MILYLLLGLLALLTGLCIIFRRRIYTWYLHNKKKMIAIITATGIIGAGSLLLLPQDDPEPTYDLVTTLGYKSIDVWNNTSQTGTFTVYNDYINYADSEGDFHPINITFVEDEYGNLVMNQSVYTIILYANHSMYRIYPDRNKNTSYITFYMPNITASTINEGKSSVYFYDQVELSKSTSNISWEDTNYSVDLSLDNSKVSFQYILANQYAEDSIEMRYSCSGVTLNANGTITGVPGFRIKNEAYDANGNVISTSSIIDTTNHTINVTLTPAGLVQYPVTIDPTYYGETQDGFVVSTGFSTVSAQAAWDACHDATTGTSVDASSSSDEESTKVNYYIVSAGIPPVDRHYYELTRAFFEFDVSALPDDSYATAGTLSIYGETNGDLDLIVVEGTQGALLTTADFDSYDTGNAFSSQVSTWSTSAYNDITLNSNFNTYVDPTGTVYFAVIGYDYDYIDSRLTSQDEIYSGMYFTESLSTSKDPHLDITYKRYPTIDLFSLPSYESPSNWDLDNNNCTFTWTTSDQDGDDCSVYITFNKGSAARMPTNLDYDFMSTTDDGTAVTLTTTSTDWSDYDGPIYFKGRAWDTVGSTSELNTTLINGIDGTPPYMTDNQAGYDGYLQTRTQYAFDVDFADATSGLKYIQACDSDDLEWYDINTSSIYGDNTYNTNWYLPEGVWDDMEEGSNTIYVRAMDVADPSWEENSSSPFNAIKDTIDPTLDSATFSDDDYAPNWYDQGDDSHATLVVAWTEGNPRWVNITVTGIGTLSDDSPDSGSSSFEIPISSESDGEYAITYLITDWAGRTDSTVSGTNDAPLKLDNTEPTLNTGSWSESNAYLHISSGDLYFSDLMTGTIYATLSGTSTDTGVGLSHATFSSEASLASSPSNDDSPASWSGDYGIATASTDSNSPATVTIYDLVGNNVVNTYDYIEDTTAPNTPTSVSCNSGDSWTTSATVTVTWGNEGDAGSGVDDYYMEYNNITPEEEPSGEDQTDTDDGEESATATFYVRGLDNVGNWGSSASDTIGIDLTNPTVSIDSIDYEGEYPISIEGDSSDATSGIDYVKITILNSTTGLYWTGSLWGSETELDVVGTTDWSYSIIFSWEYGHEYIVNATSTDVSGRDSSQAQETFLIPNILFADEYPNSDDDDIQTKVKDLHCNITGHVSWNISLKDENYNLVEYATGSEEVDGRKWLNLTTDPFETRYSTSYYLNITAVNGSVTKYHNSTFTTCDGTGFIAYDSDTHTAVTTPRYYQVFMPDKFTVFVTAYDDGLQLYNVTTAETLYYLDADRQEYNSQYDYYSIDGNDTYVLVGCLSGGGVRIYDNANPLNFHVSDMSGSTVYSIDMNETFAVLALGISGFKVVTVDETGVTALNSTTLPDSDDCRGVAIDETNHRIWISTSDNGTYVYSVDPATGYVTFIDGWNTVADCSCNQIAIDSNGKAIFSTPNGVMIFTTDGSTITRQNVDTTFNDYDSAIVIEDKYIIGTHDNTAEVSSTIYPSNLFTIKKSSNISDTNKEYTNGLDVDEDDVYIVITNEQYIQLYGFDLAQVSPPVVNLLIGGDPNLDDSTSTKEEAVRYLNQSYVNKTWYNVTAEIYVPQERYIGRYTRTVEDSEFIYSGNISDNDNAWWQDETNPRILACQYECTYTGNYSQMGSYITSHGTYLPWVGMGIFSDDSGEPGEVIASCEAIKPGLSLQGIPDNRGADYDDYAVAYYPPSTHIWHYANITRGSNGEPVNYVTLYEGETYWLVFATNDSNATGVSQWWSDDWGGYWYGDYSEDGYWIHGNSIGESSKIKYSWHATGHDMNFSNVTGLSWETYDDAHYMVIYAIANTTYNTDIPPVNIQSATVNFYNGTWENHPMTNYISNNWTVNLTGLVDDIIWHELNITVIDEAQNSMTWELFRFLLPGETEKIKWKNGVPTTNTDTHIGYSNTNSSTDLYASDYVLYFWNSSYTPNPDPGWYGDNEQREDILNHEQGVDGTSEDTGYWESTYPTDTIQTRHCLKFAGGLINANFSIEDELPLNNMYIHWWTQGGYTGYWDASYTRIHYGRTTTLYDFDYKGFVDPDYETWYYTEIDTNSSTKDAIVYDVPTLTGEDVLDPSGEVNIARLRCELIDLTFLVDNTFDSSSIYTFFAGFDQNTTQYDFSKELALMFSNYTYPSYIIFNIPDDIMDGTDNTTDSDGDGVSDHMEINITYGQNTHPFELDTDKDGYNDSVDESPNIYLYYTDRYPQIVTGSVYPTDESGEQTCTFEATIWDEDNDALNVEWWWQDESGDWHQFGSNSSVDVTGITTQATVRYTDSNFTTELFVYNWSINISETEEGLGFQVIHWTNTTYHFRAEPAEVIQNDGVDYFVWLKDGDSAYTIASVIDGFDESSEYISIWDRDSWDSTDWLWKKYYGDGTGTNFTVSKYDVVKVYLTDSSTQTIYINVEYAEDYTGNINHTLLNNNTVGKGYNFNAICKVGFSHTLAQLNATVGLSWNWNSGWAEAIGYWNDTDEGNPYWEWFIAGFPFGNANPTCPIWGILQWKIAETTKWFDTEDF